MEETKIITTRLPNKFVKSLKEIAEKEHLDTSATIRKLLAMAIKEWKIEYALEQLKNHEISISQAAHECEISVWDMIILAKKRKIDWIDYTEEDLERDLSYGKW